MKWLLVGRWKPRQLWSLTPTSVLAGQDRDPASPLARFVGSPIFSIYLRLLGAKMTAAWSYCTPTCRRARTCWSGTVIRKDVVITGYRAVDGVIQTGRVSLGRDSSSAMSVSDIATSMGDGGCGHSSSLHAGQSVPAGARWHGSPAEPTTVPAAASEPPS